LNGKCQGSFLVGALPYNVEPCNQGIDALVALAPEVHDIRDSFKPCLFPKLAVAFAERVHEEGHRIDGNCVDLATLHDGLGW